MPIVTKILSSNPLPWRGVLDISLCDKVCQWLAAGRWFSVGTLVSSTNKTPLSPQDGRRSMGSEIYESKVLYRIQWKNTYQLFCQKLLGQFEWSFAIMVPIQNYIQQFQLAREKANKGPNRVKLIKYLKIFRTNNVSAMIFGVEHW